MFGKSENRDDYQHAPGAVAAMARDLPDRHFIAPHRHRRAQLVYGTSGTLTVSTDEGAWVVPAHRAVWVPGGVEHAVRASGTVAMRTVYFDQDACHGLPTRCSVLAVTPLLRELIESATRMPLHHEPADRDRRVISLLLDELRPAATPALHLPMPADPVLAEICEQIQRCPAEEKSLREWAERSHLGRRTLARRFLAATGYSLGRWRQQALLLAALPMLADGESVTRVAAELGYHSPSAFTAMFRRSLGVPPSRYFGDG